MNSKLAPLSIQRDSTISSFNTLKFNCITDIETFCKSAGFDRIILSDLSLGAFVGNFVRNEFCWQLYARKYNRDAEQDKNFSSGMDSAGYIGKLIDEECSGDKAKVGNLNFIEQVLKDHASQKLAFIVLLPLHGYDLGQDNKDFLTLFNQVIGKHHHRLFLAMSEHARYNDNDLQLNIIECHSDMQTQHPLNSNLACIGGVIPISILKDDVLNTQICLQLSGGFVAIDPSSRKNAAISIDTLYYLRDQAIKLPDADAIYAQLLIGGNFVEFAEANFLRDQALMRYHEGGYEIAEKILRFAIDCCNDPYLKSWMVIQLQVNFISLMAFDKLQKYDITEFDNMPSIIKGYLYQNKAWGNVMCNNNEEARDQFAIARELLKGKIPATNFMYLMNISALSHAKLKDYPTAFELELGIKQMIGDMEETDWHIVYINSLNLARLYKFTGELDKSEEHYFSSFDTSFGIRSESDQVLVEISIAQLRQAQENHNAELIHTLRSAINFLAMKCPESIAPRVANAVLSRPFYVLNFDVDMIAAKFAERLQLCGLELPQSHKLVECSFVKARDYFTEYEAAASNLEAQLIYGIGLYTSKEHIGSVYLSPNYLKLEQLVLFHLISEGLCIEQGEGIIVDDMFGIGIPANSLEMAVSCFYNERESFIFNKRTMLLNNLKDQLQIFINPAVKAFVRDVDGCITVIFKRYLSPMILTPRESKSFELVLSNKANLTNDADIIRTLAAKHIFYVCAK